eukprot:CAMPEP_0197488692 /NCGR_PEP_ID=MMETSP1311-20131121/3631_1 /TAXON_ID=464262 /ORGANISM="Genus nov. species nov., Strain RCC856" /LENGTH=62 /DNA_ID=CAMNT_0043032827 /DNA_START=133 /DNA_END=317 /DNA_ORIENTATION=-
MIIFPLGAWGPLDGSSADGAGGFALEPGVEAPGVEVVLAGGQAPHVLSDPERLEADRALRPP